MGKLADQKYASELTQTFLPALEGGALVAALENGGTVLDLGCGEGAACRLIAAAYPAAKVIGVDIDEASIAKASAYSDKLANLEFVVGDASNISNMELLGKVD